MGEMCAKCEFVYNLYIYMYIQGFTSSWLMVANEINLLNYIFVNIAT